MARVDEDIMLDSESTLVFIACNVGEARRAEEVLTQNGVDYCLSFEPFIRPSIEVLSKGVDRVVVARWRAARRFARLLALGIDTGEGAPAPR